MSYRCVSRAASTNQTTNGKIRSAPLRRIRHIACLATGILCLVSLGGCNHAEYKSSLARTAYRSDTPLPGPNLLNPLPAPNCEFVSTDSNVDDRQKLDYERQCYRHAEIIARNRLRQLQVSVDRTIHAFRRQERTDTWSRPYRRRAHMS
jgi:hypothetical protein